MEKTKYWTNVRGEVKVGEAVHACISKEKVVSQHAHNTQETKPRAQIADDGGKIKEKIQRIYLIKSAEKFLKSI